MRHRRHLEEDIFRVLTCASMLLIFGTLGLILLTMLIRGLPALNLAMITQPPRGGYYLGKEGGILNAITGSLALAVGATLMSFPVSIGVVIYLHGYARHGRLRDLIRLSIDVLWGIPSIVWGAFGFSIMLLLGMRASLLGGMIALAFLELPIMVRGMDEVIGMIPQELKEAPFALGATRLEAARSTFLRQAMPGLITAMLLGFGRGIGDAASVLFTAGYTDRLPSSLLRPVASLPLAVFFQLSTPVLEVQQRAYASALILTIIVLLITLATRLAARRKTQHIIR